MLEPYAGNRPKYHALIRPEYGNSFVMAVTAEGQNRVDLCVERLCQDGCGKVTEYINSLQAGETLPVLAHMTPAEVRAVLEELVSVMAAYEGSCKR
jgi:hypothetical protein